MRTQLFLSLISLPILVAWGLPLSSMTFIGNLICSPFLIVFLLLASLIFFCKMCHLPSYPLIFIFEKLCTLWKYFLHSGKINWLYTINQKGLWICILCVLISFFIFQHKTWGTAKKSWPLFGLLFCIPFCFQKIRSYYPKQSTIKCIHKTVDAERQNGMLSVYDKGALGEKKSSGNWVQYTFLPEIAKTFGCLKFDSITVLHPTTQSLQALSVLCQHAFVKKIILYNPKKKSQEYLKRLNTLKTETDQKNIDLLSIASPTQKTR